MTQPACLSPAGCRVRQDRLRRKLAEFRLDAALLTHPRHVHYLTGHWGRSVFAAGVLVLRDGRSVLATAYEPDESVVADERVVFPASAGGTLVDDQVGALLEALLGRANSAAKIGADQPHWPPGGLAFVDLMPALFELRRTKDADEVALIRRGIAGCDAAYAKAREVLQPGVREIDLHAAVHAAAIEAVREPIGELGNDFQSGSPGGPPRDRPAQAGELMPLDLSVVVRGYSSDLCRTFSVDRQPSDAQREAHRLVMSAHEYVARTAKAGVSCRRLHEEVIALIDGQHGWRFPHHLGHGVGLAPHEAPRVNVHFDDTLRVGDVFTVEPGLYGDDLKGGVRIEEDYLVTAAGLERLSNFPTDL